MEILLASQNRHKLEELRRVLGGSVHQWVLPQDLRRQRGAALAPPPVPIEDQPDYFGNAFAKARDFSRWAGLPALADDSGLEVDALNGRPGVRSARFAGEGASSAANLARLLDELRGVPDAHRGARFVCQLVLARGDEVLFDTRATCEGRVVHSACGEHGFGYDPVFVPNGETRTFAEMSSMEKDRISHRGKALAGLAEALASGRPFEPRASHP
ncbi:MAG: non-canonical purine NTP pyrophosphatase [Planctomycetota bacterium]